MWAQNETKCLQGNYHCHLVRLPPCYWYPVGWVRFVYPNLGWMSTKQHPKKDKLYTECTTIFTLFYTWLHHRPEQLRSFDNSTRNSLRYKIRNYLSVTTVYEHNNDYYNENLSELRGHSSVLNNQSRCDWKLEMRRPIYTLLIYTIHQCDVYI